MKYGTQFCNVLKQEWGRTRFCLEPDNSFVLWDNWEGYLGFINFKTQIPSNVCPQKWPFDFKGTILRRWKKNWFDLWSDGRLIFYDDQNRHDIEDKIHMRIHCINLRVGNECRGNSETFGICVLRDSFEHQCLPSTPFIALLVQK